jgi:glucose/arabinose dehydrogenase
LSGGKYRGRLRILVHHDRQNAQVKPMESTVQSSLFGVVVAAVLAVQTAFAAEGVRPVETQSGRIAVETVASGLRNPWSLAFLPNGRMLVTEREGRIRIVTRDGSLSAPLAGVPEVYSSGQGGLLDIALAPDFVTSRLIYFSFGEPGEGGASTAVARARLGDDRLQDMTVILRTVPKTGGGAHFGSRLAFSRDGKLFVTTGERFRFDPAQDLSSHMGKVLRINPDGSVPSDNPFVGRNGPLPEIWSLGHRNVEGAAIHPETGRLWTHEMGPAGGDELNVTEAGRNYGWPLVSWGRHYDGRDIPDPPTRPDFAQSIRHWVPVIAPSGMAFYTGDTIPAWKGNLLIGGMVARAIVRLSLNGEQITGEERIPMGGRIRDVRQGPDGAVYALDESNGTILRLTASR